MQSRREPVKAESLCESHTQRWARTLGAPLYTAPVTQDEIQTLATLLAKLSASGLGVPRMPRDVFFALKGVVVQPAVEVLVTRNEREILLTRRYDQHWSGHHIPGGFVGVDEPLEAACDRVARAELGVGASFVRLIGHHTWLGHPYASALSLLCLCRTDEAPRDGQFFETLPDDLLSDHRDLLARYWSPR